jgi:probable HAF family extracellular repeat protein
VLWENGTVTDIGKGVLTAPFWNTPMAINERGDVVGFAGDPSDVTAGITHAFIWTRDGGMQLLDNGAKDNSTATSINERRQVVGYFVAADGTLHGFVWDREHGMKDLNDLKSPEYTGVIALANDINDFGVIAGRSATDLATGIRSAIIATPIVPRH